MRRFVLIGVAALMLPFSVSAQSMEWLAEHPGGVSPAIAEVASTTPIAVVPSVTQTAPNTPSINSGQAPSTSSGQANDGLQARVLQYFADIPVMIDIARCESMFRQFDSAGNPLDGGSGNMIGLYQVHATIHANFAKSMGMDIYTVDGNMAYAKYLYQHEGTAPWISSFSCWNKVSATEGTGPSLGNGGLTRDLVLGMENDEVLLLQKTLNRIGYPVALEGPGSRGQETIKFGAFTKAAVRKFQCEKMQVCSGDEYGSGYGKVGAHTRSALIAADSGNIAPAAAATQASASAIDPQAGEIARLQALIAELAAQLHALRQRS